MPDQIDHDAARRHLKSFDLRALFIDELGWDRGGGGVKNIDTADGSNFSLEEIAQKSDFKVFQFTCVGSTPPPSNKDRQTINREIARRVPEFLVVYSAKNIDQQYWHWVRRTSNRWQSPPPYIFHTAQSGRALLQRLEHLAFDLSEQDTVTASDVATRVRTAFGRVGEITRSFYRGYERESKAFEKSILGIDDCGDRGWYSSLMISRMMFVYFIQRQGFVDGNTNYLADRLAEFEPREANDEFHTFYREFLIRLFHDGLGTPVEDREKDINVQLGKVPYLNGGLFEVHTLEQRWVKINIPDSAFQRIFGFFDRYQWHLDERPLRNDREINPDILGYIFEKHVNQREMGAYYTNDDLTSYIARSTIIPMLFMRLSNTLGEHEWLTSGIWDRLVEDPHRYVQADLPGDTRSDDDESAADGGPNGGRKAAAGTLHSEEHYRQVYYGDVIVRLQAGQVRTIEEFVTHNLDLEIFAQDLILDTDDPELILAIWEELTSISVLDPTCGSGAFLFAAMGVLESLYYNCLVAMQSVIVNTVSSEAEGPSSSLDQIREVVKGITERHNTEYFVTKSIVVNNLFGVDLLEEAIEICKLRMFLKLIAQLESADEIEPLPDIEFNIQSGNAVVGYASLDEVRELTGSHMVRQIQLEGIEEKAVAADVLFAQFRELQLSEDNNPMVIHQAKEELAHLRGELNEELNLFLASECNAVNAKQEIDEDWLRAHKPFHWAVEFHDIMAQGGFDVIIGNPPFLERAGLSYSIPHFDPQLPVQGVCVERSLMLSAEEHGFLSMVLPLSFMATKRMVPLQRAVESNRDSWYASFSWRPGKLFEDVNIPLCVFITAPHSGTINRYTTGYMRWNSPDRGNLIPRIRYVESPRLSEEGWVPKYGESIEAGIMEKCCEWGRVLGDHVCEDGADMYFRTSGGLYWKVFLDFPPYFERDGEEVAPSNVKALRFESEDAVCAAVAACSSDLFWWWLTVTSDMRSMSGAHLKLFPMPDDIVASDELIEYGWHYLQEMRRNSHIQTREYQNGRVVRTQQFKLRDARPTIEEMSRVVAKLYGLNSAEVEFIVNYDLRWRMASADTDDE